MTGSNEVAKNLFRTRGFFEFRYFPTRVAIKNGKDFICEDEIFFYSYLKFDD